MTDEELNKEAENTAKMLAIVYRLSQLLNIPIEDAATVFMKIGTKLKGDKKTS
jgi:hypothetical protein